MGTLQTTNSIPWLGGSSPRDKRAGLLPMLYLPGTVPAIFCCMHVRPCQGAGALGRGRSCFLGHFAAFAMLSMVPQKLLPPLAIGI